MEEKLDEMLRQALVPTEEPDTELNREMIEKIDKMKSRQILLSESRKQHLRALKESKEHKIEAVWADRQAEAGKKRWHWKSAGVVPVVLGAALLIGAGSLTAIAAYKYLTPDKVAEEAGDIRLSDAFINSDAVVINQSQTYGNYRVTLLGIVSGENISERFRKSNGRIIKDRTYVVVAIEHADGSPITMDLESEKGEEEEEFFVSPLIRGLHPAFYNAASMHGNYTEMVEEGILYRLLECDDVEIFADRDLYLCVSDGSVFYNENAYHYDQETGEIFRNEDYAGLNALFRLPMDASAADPEKAEALIQSLEIEAPEILWEKRIPQKENSTGSETAEETGKGAAEGETVEETGKGSEAVEYALQFVGNPYKWNGESLTEGCDCSGFVKAVYTYFGISLPHSTAAQRDYGEEVQGLENARPGDLIFYESPNHVGIYIGDGKIVHADPEFDICVSGADYDEIVMIRRIFYITE